MRWRSRGGEGRVAVKPPTQAQFNLQYGLLAQRIGEALGRSDANLNLLVEFVEPKSVTNTEYVLVMRSEFADALKQAGWI